MRCSESGDAAARLRENALSSAPLARLLATRVFRGPLHAARLLRLLRAVLLARLLLRRRLRRHPHEHGLELVAVEVAHERAEVIRTVVRPRARPAVVRAARLERSATECVDHRLTRRVERDVRAVADRCRS